MAQAGQSTIIDLTGEDDNDDSSARAHAAYQKAFAAASRLANLFESSKASKPIVHQKTNGSTDLTGCDSLPAPVFKTKTSPRLGTFPKPVGSEKDGLRRDEKNDAIPRQNISVPSPSISAAQSALGAAVSKSIESPSTSEKTEVRKQQPRETTFTPKAGTFTSRTPRSAAISARQNIADACNQLENWIHKDPDLIPQQTRVSTPRRLGRPNDDLDEWSPISNGKDKDEEGNELGTMITNSPTSSAGKHEHWTANADSSLSQIQGVSTSQGTKKRKFSESFQSHAPPVKMPRWNGESSAHHESTPPNPAESVNGKHVHEITGDTFSDGVYRKCVHPAINAAKVEYRQNLTEDDLTGIGKIVTKDIMEQGVEAFCPASRTCPKQQRTELILKSVSEAFHERARRLIRPINSIASVEESPKGIAAPLLSRESKSSLLDDNALREATVKTTNKSPPKPSGSDFGTNGVSAKPTTLHTDEKIDPRLQRGFPGILDPISESGPYSASPVHVRYTAVFESVVYPAIKKSKKRHIHSVSGEDLNTIGKIVVDEVMERLESQSEDPNQLNEDTRKKIKRFVKKSFRRRVRKAIAQSSHNSATPANDSKFQAANFAEPDHPVIHSFDLSENDSSNWASAVNKKEDAREPRQSSHQHLDQQTSSSLQHSPSGSPTSFFPPGFDRGRYPALRRRRGNKYYTPERIPKPASTFEKNHYIPSIDRILTAPASDFRDDESRESNGKDHVRLLKALAHQSTNLPSRATLASERSASIEASINRAHVKFEPARSADVAKAQQEQTTANNQLAQRIPRKTLLEDISPQREVRPRLRSKLATALDPSLEHVVAVLVTDTSRGPSRDGQKYTITSRDQMQLIKAQSIVKHVGPTLKTGKSKLVRIETKVIDPVRPPGRCISSLLRNRELGLTSRGRHVGTVGELWQLKTETIEPWKNWKGASGDVVAVAWHPDSNAYAFGAAAHTNIEDIQYNRPCNLLLGNLTSNQIKELPDHRIDRPKPETIPNGPNANQAVYEACDPKVYETVTSIAFSPTGDRMFTASHDCTVKIWDVSGGEHECLSTLSHRAWVTSIEVSEHQPGLFATASKSVKDAVRIYRDSSCFVNFSSSRAETRPEWKIYPECLRWGPNPFTSHLLLAGFQQWEQQGDLLSGGGQLCLWDANALESIKVTPSSQSVYAAAWHPTHPFFATGGAPGNNIIDKINTKTVVRTWDVRTPKRYQVEYECPATDMQDVTFSPSNPNIVTAGCTDGSSYVWDWRWPDQVLHRLKHGRPLAELDHTRKREEADTGVMLSLWGPGGSLFYTGSSDGMIKAWDVRRHPTDVLVRNVANFEVSIQSGAFSPDGHNLLVGDAEGGIHILSSAPCGPRSNVKSTDAYIDLVRASDGSGAKLEQDDDNPGTEGVEAARSLIESGQLEFHEQLGVGQGPSYRGPYAIYARKEIDGSGVGRLRRRFEKKQPISKRGEKRWEQAVPMTSLLRERKQKLDREKDGEKMVLEGLDERRSEATHRSRDGKTVQPTSRPGGANSSGNGNDGATVSGGEEDHSVEYNTIPEDEMIEENFWWVRMGEEEIEQARSGRMRW